jgi:polysaccharide deacetylase 2 family uncharacterized protein YibQ
VILALVFLVPGRQDTTKEAPAGKSPEAYAPSPEDAFPEKPPGMLKLSRRVDFALIQAMFASGYGPDNLLVTDVGFETHLGERYSFQVLSLSLDGERDRFLRELNTGLDKWAPAAQLEAVGESLLVISVLGRTTHRIEITGPAPETGSKEGDTPRLALVIDDLGRDLAFARKLAALKVPVTFSILPKSPHGTETARLAAEAGREIMLHQPMEPIGYPQTDPGPGALLLDMKPEDIRSRLAENLKEIGAAAGVNNHTGSAFTRSLDALSPVMSELGRRRLFFLDSLTTTGSAVAEAAEATGLAYYRRSIFLDNRRDKAYVLRQLEKAENMSRITGQAIAIGHPYPETLEALREWSDERIGDVEVTPVGMMEPINHQGVTQ